MSMQRRRGQRITIYPEKVDYDSDGNKVIVPDFDNPIRVKGAATPLRSSRAEVPGQVEVDLYTFILPVREGVGMWSCFEWRGQLWDAAAPPAYRHGTKQVRHISVDVRERANG